MSPVNTITSSKNHTPNNTKWVNMGEGAQILCQIMPGSSKKLSPQPVQLIQSPSISDPSKQTRLVKISPEIFKLSQKPGIHYLEEPPQSGVLIRKSEENELRLLTSMDFKIQSLYQDAVYESYSDLNLSHKHPDISNRSLPDGIPSDSNRPDQGLHAFSLVASIGTIDEWRGQEEDEKIKPLELFYSVSDNKEMNGFVMFGKTNNPQEYYVGQMGACERGKGLGEELMQKVISHIKEKEQGQSQITLLVGTRHGNTPAEKLYGEKLGMNTIDASEMGLPSEKYIGFKMVIPNQ